MGAALKMTAASRPAIGRCGVGCPSSGRDSMRLQSAVLCVGTMVLSIAVSPTSAAAAPPSTLAKTVSGDRLTDPDAVLPKGWRTAQDRAVTVVGDSSGLHVFVADEAGGYAWRTAATLTDAAYDADQWIGQACFTGSG